MIHFIAVFQDRNNSLFDRALAFCEIGVENRDYHYLSLSSAYSAFIRHRRPNLGGELWVARAVETKIHSGLFKAKRTVGASANLIYVVVILPVIFPKADFADFVASTTMKRFETAARAMVGLILSVGLRDVLKHLDILHRQQWRGVFRAFHSE